MGKKIASKGTVTKLVKKQDIKKSANQSKKNHVKKSPNKTLFDKKHNQVISKHKSKNVTKNNNNKGIPKQTNKVQPSKKKSTKMSCKKVKQQKQVQKSFGSKKINIQNKKSQKNQRLLNFETDKIFNQLQQNYQIQIQKQHQSQFAIYRKQVPQRWRESIIRYHEAKMSLSNGQSNSPTFQSNFINHKSYNANPKNFNEVKNISSLKNQPKEQQNIGIRKSIRLKKPKIQFQNNKSQQARFPQVIQISSSHNSVKSQNNYVSFDFQENMYSDLSRNQQSQKFSDYERSISIKNDRITPQKYQIQKENDSSVFNYLKGHSSKSQSKVSSYQYQIMSLSSSKQRSIKSIIPSHKGKGKSIHNLSQKSQLSLSHAESQSQQKSSHSISPQYTVQRIVSSKLKGGKTFYQIKWVGYPDEQNTLQPIKNLKNIMQMVVDFQKSQKQTFKQTLKQTQKTLAERNRQIISKNKQLIQKTKKLDDMKKKVEQLTKKVKDLQKQKKVFSKIEQPLRLKNQWNIKSQIALEEIKIKQEPFGFQRNIKIKIPQEENQKDKISNSTQVTQTKRGIYILQSTKMHQFQKRSKESTQLSPFYNQITKAFQNPQEKVQKIKEEIYDMVSYQKIAKPRNINKQNIVDQQIMQQQKDEMVIPLCSDNLMRIQDFDQGHINPDLQMVEYSFPFFSMENHEKNDKNIKYLQPDQNVIQQNNLQNHPLLQEYDCLKYLCTDQ